MDRPLKLNSKIPNSLTECGLSSKGSHTDPTSVIIGGEEAESGAWPWMASLGIEGTHVCGAVLIHPRFLLTAAHCLSDE